jgi:hypothetical protein
VPMLLLLVSGSSPSFPSSQVSDCSIPELQDRPVLRVTPHARTGVCTKGENGARRAATTSWEADEFPDSARAYAGSRALNRG